MQLDYSTDHTALAAGMTPDFQDPIMSEALTVSTVAGIGLGLVASFDTSQVGACVLGGTAPAGITRRCSKAGNGTSANTLVYERYSLAELTVIGSVICPVSGAVAVGDAVAYNTTTGVLTAGPSADGEYDLPGARFVSAADDGGLAEVRIMHMGATPYVAPAE